MKQTIIVLLSCCMLLTLHGCVTPEKTIFTIHFARGGSGMIEIRQLDLQSDAEGAKAEQEITDYIRDFEANTDPEARADDTFMANATNYSQEIGYDDQGKLNSHQHGEFGTFFQMLEALNITSEVELSADQTFTVQWDGDILTIAMCWENDEDDDDAAGDGGANEDEEDDDDFGIEFVLTTDGEFDSISIGTLSADHKKVVVTVEDLKAAEEAKVNLFEVRISGLARESN